MRRCSFKLQGPEAAVRRSGSSSTLFLAQQRGRRRQGGPGLGSAGQDAGLFLPLSFLLSLSSCSFAQLSFVFCKTTVLPLLLPQQYCQRLPSPTAFLTLGGVVLFVPLQINPIKAAIFDVGGASPPSSPAELQPVAGLKSRPQSRPRPARTRRS